MRDVILGNLDDMFKNIEKIKNEELERKPRIGNSSPRNELESNEGISEEELLTGLNSDNEVMMDVDTTPKEKKPKSTSDTKRVVKRRRTSTEGRSDVFEPINNQFKEGLVVENPLAQYMNDFLNEMGKQGYTMEDYFTIQMEKYGQTRNIVRNGIYRLINKGELSFPKFIETVEGFGYTLNIQIKYNPDADHPEPSKDPIQTTRKDVIIDESVDEYLRNLNKLED